ncbi:MAG: helix-turn-helix domain-containing protein [Reyranella sp.]|nr:helix-turn-helix domain-containing protein [Reyranella sp.]
MQGQIATRVAKFPVTVGLRSPMAGGIQMILGKGEELFAEGDDAEYFYEVVSGAIRSYKLLSDGRRQIDAFHLRGDIFGLEAGREHRFSAEAVGEVQVIAYRRSRLSAIIEEDAAFRDRIMSATLRNLQRAQDHMLLLGRKTAQEKLATFLLDMAQRLSNDAEHFDLPMQRSDIADHLGLTIETVSRTLTQFTRSGLIRLPPAGRSISLCNRMALKNLDA